MRKVIIMLLLLFSVVVNATTYYVATNGNNSNPGTITQPFATWQYAFNKLSAGDILYVRGGTYTGVYGASGSNYYGVKLSSSRSGTSSARITVSAYQNEIPVLDCAGLVSTNSSMTAGVMVECSYWNFIGLSVTNVAEGTNHPAYGTANGWQVNGDFLTFNRCNSYHNGGGFAGGGDYVYFTNCDSYENNDVYDNGGYCNGFSCNIGAGHHVFYEGCRAWANSDDGFDMYGGSQIVVFNNCWAFENGYWNGYTGDGAGFKTGKVGTQTSGLLRTITNCLSFNNNGYGIDESQDWVSSAGAIHHLYNNTIYHNGYAFNFAYDVGSAIDIVRNNIAYDNKSFGTIWNGNTIDHNSWQNGLNITEADFASLNSNGVKGARGSDGSLPVLDFLHLASGSRLIDAGVDVGLPYSGNAPEIGAFETQGGSTPAPVPVLVSAVVENSTPSLIEMTYDLTLANSVPVNSAFDVQVNSVARNVISVSVSGKKVLLTLESDIKFNDIITVSYTKPLNNSLQSSKGAKAPDIDTKLVTNNTTNPAKDTPPDKIKMTIFPNPVHQIINILIEYTSAFSLQDPAISSQIIRIFDFSGKLSLEKLIDTGALTAQIPINLKPGIYIVQMLSGSLTLAAQKIIVY